MSSAFFQNLPGAPQAPALREYLYHHHSGGFSLRTAVSSPSSTAPSSLVSGKLWHSRQPGICPICQRVFSNKFNLKTAHHQHPHHGGRGGVWTPVTRCARTSGTSGGTRSPTMGPLYGVSRRRRPLLLVPSGPIIFTASPRNNEPKLVPIFGNTLNRIMYA